MSEDTLTFTVVYTFCALVYVAAFTIAYIKSQNMTVYVVLFVIQLLFLLYELSGYKSSGSSDAAGSGMAEGYFHLLLLSIQIILSFTVLIILLVRVSSVKFWIYFGIVAAVITLCIIAYRNINFKNIIRTPYKEKNKVELRIEHEICAGNIDRKAKIYAAEKLLKTINDNYLPDGITELTEEEFISKIKVYASRIDEDSGTYSLYYDGLFQDHYIIIDVSNTDIPVNARIGGLYD